jgi:hypothetical protein
MSGLKKVRRHPALLLLSAFVFASVSFIACGGPDDGIDESQGPVNCAPHSVRRCRGPKGCLGEQSCLDSGREYSACVCTWRPNEPDASTDAPSSNDASDDAPSSNDAGDDAPSSNDASDDAPSSNDAGDDAPSSNDAGDASDDAPSSNGWGSFNLSDLIP